MTLARPTAVPKPVPKPSDPHEHWADRGRALNRDLTEMQWQLGDWAADKPRSITDESAADLAGFSIGTIRACRWLSRKFSPSRRRQLSHTHHAAVGALPEAVADSLLDDAARERWNVARIRAEARLAAAESEVERARAEAARERAAASGAWRADSARAVRECGERLARAAADIRIAEDVVAELAAHPNFRAVHGNAVNGTIERLRAVFEPAASALSAWAARRDRFARLRHREAPA